MTDAREEAFHKREVANYRQIEKILQSATPKQRATMIKQNGLEGAFDADGALRAEKLRELGENVIDGQMDTQGENAQGEGISAAESVQFRFEDGKDQADNELVEFYQSVLSMANPQNASKRKQGLGQVSPSHATLVSDIIKKETGKQMDVSDFEIVMDGSAVNHIEERHGKNGKADHSMEDEANIARIPWAMNNATQVEIMRDKDGNFDLDTAYKNADGSSSYKVKLERPIGNDRFYVVECVPDSARKQLIVKSAYIEKGSRGQVVTREADGSPYPTSETFRADATNNSIPQNPDLSTASGEKSSGNFDHRFMSPDLWRREGEVQREIAKISKDSGENISVLARDLSDEGKKQHTRLKKAFATLSEVSGGRLQMVVVEKNSTFTGAYAHGDTVYISADAIESGKWGEALIEESVHFTQGTQEHSLLRAFLVDDTELLAKFESELTKAGNDYGFTAEDAEAFRAYLDGNANTELTGRALRYSNELTAHMSAELLSNEAVIDRLVGQHATLAERILIKFKQLGRAFAKDKALAKRVADAEQIYLAAIERRGWRYENGKIVGAEDEEKSTINYLLKQYTDHQKENWKDSKRIVVYDSEKQFREFIRTVRSNPTFNKKMYFGAIPEAYAAVIKNETGIDVNNYNCTLASDEIRKIFKDHGDEQREALRGQRAITEDDIVHIPEVLQAPDKIKLSDKKYDGKSAIEFTKNIDGRLTVVAVVSDKHLDLRVQTAYANKKRDLATPIDEHASINTPEASRGTVSNDSIAQKSNLSTPKTDFRAKEQTSDDLSNNQPKKKSKTKAEVLEDNARLREEKKKANERADERDDRELSPLYLLDVIDKNI